MPSVYRICCTLCLVALANIASANEKLVFEKIDTFASSLKKALKQGLKEGPHQALSVCKDQAPAIAKKISDASIKVGRVSHKPRNSLNIAQQWMREPIERYLKGKEKSPIYKVKLSNNENGYLKPIKTGVLCLTCHGQNIEPSLLKKIKQLYPNDQAIGFKQGDIRGFFYATVHQK